MAHVNMRPLEPSTTHQQTSTGFDVLEFVTNEHTHEAETRWGRGFHVEKLFRSHPSPQFGQRLIRVDHPG